MFSFRAVYNLESGNVTIQGLSGEYYITLVRFKLSNDFKYSTISFMSYDRIERSSGILVRYIRYLGLNKDYEKLLGIAWENASSAGYSIGKVEGIEEGKLIGYGEGYDEGYDDGLVDGEVSELSVPEVITSYINGGVTLFKNIFGFEIFGINVSALIGGLTAVVVLAWVIRKLVR